MKKSGIFIAASLLISCAPEAAKENTQDTFAPNPTIDKLFAHWDTKGSPGCGLAIGQDGDLVYARGYGYANLDYDIAITPDTVFDVGSVTKQFTAAIINELAAEGKLSLDDDIRTWLPQLPAFEKPITLRQMIHHTSGLRDYLNLFPLAGRGDYFPISHAHIREMMARQKAPIFTSGERYRYSNTAYMLLSQVIERASGKSLGEMASARYFSPLKMTGSYMYEDLEKVIPYRATGYERAEDDSVRIVHNYNFDVTGDGQLYTTMRDLITWDHYLHGPEKPAIHASMMEVGVLNSGEKTGYAHGLVLGEYRGLKTVGHSGGSWGFVTQLMRFVDHDFTVAISCNDGNAAPRRLLYQVADYYLADHLAPKEQPIPQENDEPEQEKIKAMVLTADQLQEFNGTYYSYELDATYRISTKDGALMVKIEQEPKVKADAKANDQFEVNFYKQGWLGPGTAHITFERDENGTVTSYLLSSRSERGLKFEKVSSE